MNCQIPYINNTINNSSLNDEEKQKNIELATEAHRFLVKQIINDGVIKKLNNRLYLKNNHIDDPVFKELLISRGWDDAVKINDEIINDKKQQYLSFNIFKAPSLMDDLENAVLENAPEEYDDVYYQSLFSLPSLVNMKSHLENLLDKDGDGKFKQFVVDVKNKLFSYRNSLEKVEDNYQVALSKQEVDGMIRSLNDEDVNSIMEGTDRYIRASVSKLNYLSQLFFGATSSWIKSQQIRLGKLEKKYEENPSEYNEMEVNKVKNIINNPPKSIKQRLKLVDEKRKTATTKQEKDELASEINDINELIQQGRYYYHLFDNLGKLHKDVKMIDGIERSIDRFDKERLSNFIIEYVNNFNEENNTNLLADDIAKNAFTVDGGVDMNMLKNYLEKEGVENILSFIHDFNAEIGEMGRPSFLYSLEESLKLSSDLKESMDDLYTEVLTTTFFPEYEQHFEEFKKKAKADGEDAYLDDKYLLNRDRFKEMVRVALKDVNAISHLLDATIGINDQLTQFMTLHIKNLFNKVRIDGMKEQSKIEKIRKKYSLDEMDIEQKNQIFDKMKFSTKKVALNKYGKIQHILEADPSLSSDEQIQQIKNKALEENSNKDNIAKGVSYIPIDVLGTTFYVQAIDEEDLLTEYDDFQYRNEKMVFEQLLDRKVKEVFQKLPIKDIINNDVNAAYDVLTELENEYDIDFSKLTWKKENTKTQEEYLVFSSTLTSLINDKEGILKIDFNGLRNIVQSAFYASFYSKAITPKTGLEQKAILWENSLIHTVGNSVSFNYRALDESIPVRKNLKKLASEITNVRGENSTNTPFQNAITFSIDRMLSISSDNELFKKILVKRWDVITETYFYDEVIYKESEFGWFPKDDEQREKLDSIVNFYRTKGDLVRLTDDYKVGGSKSFKYDGEFDSKYNAMQNYNERDVEIFETLKGLKETISSKLGRERRYGLYSIQQGDVETLTDTIRKLPRRALDKTKDVLDVRYFEETEAKSRYNIEEKKWEYLNDKNEVVEEKDAARVSKKKYGIDGNVIDEIGMGYADYLHPRERERDLLHSFNKMRDNVDNYYVRTHNLPQIKTLETLIKGDEKAGISPRKAQELTSSGEVILDKNTNERRLAEATKLNKNLTAFINDMMYGMSKEEHAIGFGNVKIDMHKVTNAITGLSAIQALALNFAAMPPNHFISTISNYSEASMGRNFDRKIFRQTYRELFVSKSAIINYLRDYQSNSIIDKSKLAQAAIMFDVVQGEMMDSNGVIHRTDLAKKLASDALFSTSNAVEYTNQMLTMVCLMKGFKNRDVNGNVVLNSKGVEQTLYNSITHTQGEFIEFEDWVTEDVKLKFTNLVQGINRQLHGNYKNADKNLLNRTWYGRMALLFKRWIYNTVTARFQPEQLDWEQYTIEEGYFRTYLSKITSEYKDLVQQNGMKGFTDMKVLPQYGKAIGKTVLKTGVEAFRSSLRNLPIISGIQGYKEMFDNKSYEEWMYGSTISERQKRAIERTSAELGLILQIMVIGFLFHLAAEANDDDKEDIDYIALRWLEYYSFKMQSEMQFYTPFLYLGGLPAGSTIDTAQRFLKDPLTMTRMIDVNLGLVRHLLGFSLFNNEGEFEFDWEGNDTYDRSGKGYEKGDLKVMNKLEKSIVSPWYQVMKMSNPDQQLSYMELVFKNK